MPATICWLKFEAIYSDAERNGMNYKICKLEFNTPVHFGNGALSDTEKTFCADTLFSALYIEALKIGQADELYHRAKSGTLLVSDAFPYVRDEYYLPKPMIYIEPKDVGDSVQKKRYKKLQYVPVSMMQAYLNGMMPKSGWELDELGDESSQVMAAVRREEDTLPYVVGNFHFSKGSGLYFILAYEDDNDKYLAEDLLVNLSFAGIGGKRSGGKGRFDFKYGKNTTELENLLKNKTDGRSLLLSTALPKDEELTQALQGSSYLLQKRSGFVLSETYAPEQRKKRDLFTMQAGSCFQHRFEGDIYDVSMGGAHPVYRYAKAIFAQI